MEDQLKARFSSCQRCTHRAAACPDKYSQQAAKQAGERARMYKKA